MRGEFKVNGNRGVSASQKAIAVSKNGTSGNLAEIDYSGKATLADAEISATGRTLTDSSVLRSDEVFAQIEKRTAPFVFSVTSSLATFDPNNTTEALIQLEGSGGDNARKRETFDPSDVASNFTLQNVIGTGSNPETRPSNNNDANPYLIKVPANSGPFSIMYIMYSNSSTADMDIYSYTSSDASTGKTTIASSTSAGGFDASDFAKSRSVLFAHVANSTSDLFYGFSFRIQSSSGSDDLSFDGTKELTFEEYIHEGEGPAATSPTSTAASRLPMVTFYRGMPFMHFKNRLVT